MSNFLTNLVSHWNLDEASGNALDAHGSNELTDNNTVTAGTGVISGCRVFNPANVELFSLADNADMSVAASTSFTFTAWVNLATNSAIRGVLGKFDSSDEYALYYTNASNRFRFDINGSNVVANTFGAPSTATWYFLAAGYDATNTVVWISVNAGTRDTTSDANGTSDGTNAFVLGSIRTGQFYFDGSIDHVSYWKNRVINDSELGELYNSGSGLAYANYAGAAGQPTVKRQGGVAFMSHGGYQPGSGSMRW